MKKILFVTQLGVLTKIMKKILFVTLAVIMLGCIEILPKPTESGKNNFGCKINGEKFIPEKKGLPLVRICDAGLNE